MGIALEHIVKFNINFKTTGAPYNVGFKASWYSDYCYQPDWVTINLGAGVASVRAAAKFYATTSIKLVGVSYLTSMCIAAVQQVNNNHQALADNFTHLVRCGLMWGVNHFVCAGTEANLVKKIQPLAHTFCPGVTTLRNDQVRTTDAVHTAMIDYLIIGRQITTDANPARVCHKLTRDGKLNCEF